MRYFDTEGSLLRYSWCKRDFILGTIMRPPLDASAWPLGSTQSWHRGLIVEGQEMAGPVVPKVLLQDTFNEQYSVQSKGTLVSRSLRSERNGKSPTGVFISSRLAELMRLEGKGVVIDGPQDHVGVRFVSAGYSEFDLSAIADLDKHSVFLKAHETYSPIVIEVALTGMYYDFAALKNAVLSNDAEVEDGRLGYATIYVETLTVSTEPDRIPLVNGKRIDYHPEAVDNSPFINSRHGSGIINITVGEQAALR